MFAGWYADPTGQTEYKFDGKIMPAQNITVYAKWVPPTYTVTLYDHDGNQVYALTIAKGAKLDESQVPTITLDEGETFLGWTLKDGTPFNLDTEINRDYELHARVGSQKGYSVKYDGNGAAGTPPEDKTNYAEGSYADVKLPGDLAMKDKAFLGWATVAANPTTIYQPGDKLPIDASMATNGIITLYAVWGDKPVQTKLTYKANFEGAEHAEKVYELENNATETIKSYDETGLSPRSGYEFLGWSEDPKATEATYKAGDQIVVDDETDATAKNILYAIWKQSVTSVKVAKQVTGNFGDKTREFKFEITFTDANGKALRLVQTDKAPTYSITSDTTVGGEKLTVLMKDKGEITLTNVPIGGTLVVTEIEASGYQTSYKIGETESQEGNVARYIVPENGGTITFINHRNVSPDTGVFVDSLPYILIIACVAGVAALFLIRRRKKRED